MENISFGLTDYYDKPEYFFKYIDLRFKYGRVKRKDILNKANIYQSAFSKAKQTNYVKSESLIDKFEKYYQLDSLEYSMLLELEEDVSKLVFSIYYLNPELRDQSYIKIKEKEQWFATTYIAIIFKLFDLMYEISRTEEIELNSSLMRRYRDVEAYYELLVPSLQLLFMYVGFTIKDYNVNTLNRDIGIMERRLLYYPALRGCGLYRVACGFKKLNVYNASIQYYKESLDCVLEDVNVNRIVLIEKQLFDLYCKIGALHKAYSTGKKLLLCINHKMYDELFTTICFELTILCVQLEYYNEALYYCKLLDYEISREYKTLYMFINYKLNNYSCVTNMYDLKNEWNDIHTKVMSYIYEKTLQKNSKKEMRIQYAELTTVLRKSENSSISRYIDQLK